MAFFLKAIGLSDDIPGFPFTPAASDPGHVVYTSPLMCWTVRAGAPHDDAQKKVSIFTCSLPSSSSSGNQSELVRQLARNALRRAKSLMIPGFLKCFGATEYRDTVYIATEACVSLKEVLESRELRTQLYGTAPEEYYASVAYGLSTIGEALGALHHNHLAHGNVNCASIFVLPSSGMWRLFGLELVSAPEEVGANNPNCVFDNARRAGLLEGYRCPPEYAPGAASSSSGGPSVETSAIDSWGVAGLLYETVGVPVDEAVNGKLSSLVHTLSSAELRNACRLSLPKSLHSGCSAITAANPRIRQTVQAFVESCPFVKDSAFVQYMKGLSEALLLDLTHQVRLVESLAEVVGSFPLRPCLCYVLPRLGELIRAAAKPHSANAAAGVSIGPVVAPVLKIAARVSAGDDFDTYVTPVLVMMFQSPDVLMRYKLLVGAEVYAGKLSASALNNVIWPLYAKGFQYSTPSVREYSGRALVHLAPHMSEAVLGDQVPKALGLLQRDQDGALRANATIALHLISAHITPPTLRASVMLNYCRPMLRDTFEPSRVAALRSLRGAVDCLTAKQMAESVLPAVSPLTVDPTSEESRSVALALIKAVVSKLDEHHRHLATQQPTAPAGAAPASAAAASSSTVTSGSPRPAAEAASGGSSWGWGLFESSSPSTPAATLPAPIATAAAAAPSRNSSNHPRHVDASSSSLASSSASPISAVKASPLPKTTTTAAHTTTVLPAAMASSAAGGSGWSDDDDEVGSGAACHAGGNNGDGWDEFEEEDEKDKESFTASKPSAGAAMKVKAMRPASVGVASAVPLRSTAPAAAASAATARPPPPPLSSALHSSSPSSFAASPLPAVSSTSSLKSASSPGGSAGGLGNPGTGSATSAGPMKLRKKGGLGAARLD